MIIWGNMELFELIKNKISLPDFLDTQIGCTLSWMGNGESARTICPLPNHKDNKPSFYVNKREGDVWVYHCFGCDSSGTIIDFYQEYYGLDSPYEAVLALCKKYGIKKEQAGIEYLQGLKKTVNLKKKVEYANMVTSNQCRMLLRKDFEKNSKWVAKAYKSLNVAVDKEDISSIEGIGFKAFEMMSET